MATDIIAEELEDEPDHATAAFALAVRLSSIVRQSARQVESATMMELAVGATACQ